MKVRVDGVEERVYSYSVDGWRGERIIVVV